MDQQELQQKVRKIFEEQEFDVSSDGNRMKAVNGEEIDIAVYSSENYSLEDLKSERKEDELVFVDEEGFTHYDAGGDFSFSIIIEELPDGSYKALLSDPLFTESIFTRLFFMEGRHTEHFDKFSDKSSVRGERIIVWKVVWDGKSRDAGDSVVIDAVEGEDDEEETGDLLESILFS